MKTAKITLEDDQAVVFKALKRLNGSTQDWHLRQAVKLHVTNLKRNYGAELQAKIEEVENEN